MNSQNLLLFRVTNWNDRPTPCSTPCSQIIYCQELFFPSKNLLLPEINSRMQSCLPYGVHTIYSVRTVLNRTIFKVPKQCDVNSSLVPHAKIVRYNYVKILALSVNNKVIRLLTYWFAHVSFCKCVISDS